jgi:hypothetical protein
MNPKVAKKNLKIAIFIGKVAKLKTLKIENEYSFKITV